MNSLLINFEFDDTPPTNNKMYCNTRKGGLYVHPKVLLFKENIRDIFKKLQFEKTEKNVKLDIKFYVKKQNIDIDGPIKVLLDAMNKIVYDDDRQIIELHVYKIYGKIKKTIVDVFTIEKV
jgi:Holliday junction resolvase RusA-like endonuclease